MSWRRATSCRRAEDGEAFPQRLWVHAALARRPCVCAGRADWRTAASRAGPASPGKLGCSGPSAQTTAACLLSVAPRPEWWSRLISPARSHPVFLLLVPTQGPRLCLYSSLPSSLLHLPLRRDTPSRECPVVFGFGGFLGFFLHCLLGVAHALSPKEADKSFVLFLINASLLGKRVNF